MTDPPSPQVFLERQSYRRRRMMDAARLLPLIGAALLAVPLLWPQPGPDADIANAADAVPMSAAIIYIFAVWAGLIGLSAVFGVFARRLTRNDARSEPDRD